jgi:hypothetical protein
MSSDDESLWLFSGAATGKYIEGATVTFGGLLAGMTATVANGSFSVYVNLSAPTRGEVSAVVTDMKGNTAGAPPIFVELT